MLDSVRLFSLHQKVRLILQWQFLHTIGNIFFVSHHF